MPVLSMCKPAQGSGGPRQTAPVSFMSHRRFVSASKFILLSVIFATLGNNVLNVEAADGDDGVTSFFSSDGGRQCACSYDVDTDYFPDKLTPNYAQNFNVQYFKHYKVITVDMPGDRKVTYFAYLCGTPMPDVPEGATAIEIPLRNVGVMSTTMLPAFEYIRQRDIVDFVNVDTASIASSCMQEYITEGAVVTTDSGNVAAAIQGKTLDAVFVGQFSENTAKTAIAANCASTNTIIYNAGGEDSVLGTAEWVEFVALFFNREEAATDIISNIASRYECAVDKAATAFDAIEEGFGNKTVLWVSFWSETYGWYISACDEQGTDSTRSAWYCEMLNHVGAVSLDYSALGKPGGSLTMDEMATLDLESIDVVIWAMDDLNEERAMNADLDDLFANITNAEIFDITKHGVNMWFQSRPAEPDVLLQDIVSVFLPNADIAEHERYYLRNASDPTDLQMNPATDVCADPSAPLFSNYRTSACDDSNTLIPGLDRPVPSCEDQSERVFSFSCAPTTSPTSAPTGPTTEPTSAPTGPTKAPTTEPTKAPTSTATAVASLNAALFVSVSLVASALMF